MKKPTRREVLSMAPAAAMSAALPVAAAAKENPFEKVRRLGNELSAALAEAGEIEYAYVRPAGIEFPVLLANRSDPGHLAKFYLREYEEAVSASAGEVANKAVHIKTLAHIISDMMQAWKVRYRDLKEFSSFIDIIDTIDKDFPNSLKRVGKN